MKIQKINFGAKCFIDSKIVNYVPEEQNPAAEAMEKVLSSNEYKKPELKDEAYHEQIFDSIKKSAKTIEKSKSKKTYRVDLKKSNGIDYLTLNNKKVQALGFGLNQNLEEKIIEKFKHFELGWCKRTLIAISNSISKGAKTITERLSKIK